MDQKEINRYVVSQFRAGGEIKGMHRDRLLLLTTRGASSGEERVAPMMFHRDGDVVYVIASNNGAEDDPSWYRNLLNNAEVVVEVGDEKYEAVASTIQGAARRRVWEAIVKVAPFFEEHQSHVKRQIPVVALNRVE
jgi:deazaflavin-dependent oxidoreductase (nitroreductase family)